ncbi:hypothetical protein PSTT_03912 [Puccinia striiformis]|uniref:Uncharacterized protein n=1 Tax=Puccinia striiformis TaxID=27350 RepID=A0A2S4VUI5_9BASI|nr:hypothetical protein PSTT_03912 [Puccinia striiformis]
MLIMNAYEVTKTSSSRNTLRIVFFLLAVSLCSARPLIGQKNPAEISIYKRAFLFSTKDGIEAGQAMKDAGEAGTGAKDVKNATLHLSRAFRVDVRRRHRWRKMPENYQVPNPHAEESRQTLERTHFQRTRGAWAGDPSIKLMCLQKKIHKSTKTPIAPKPSELKPISTEEVKGGQLQDGKENVESFKGDQSRTDQYKGQKSQAEQSKRAQFKSSQLKAIKEPSAPISDIQGESKSAKTLG